LHQHGLVHRDIKPSNVIFVNRAPKLGDIGLVTEAGDTNSIVGTEGYIPPEGPGTPQADIFSLGKVLYEISTGMDRRRFSELPDDLRSWPDRGAVVEFNEIVLRACAKDPARRYQSAEQMRADLELLEEGRSVSQKRAVERRWQVFKRLAPVGAAVLGVLSIPLGFRWFMPPPAPLAPRVEKRSTNEVANQMYDLGNVYLDGSKFQKAAEQFELSVQADPSFARAYARLAWVHTWTEGETNGWNFEWQFRDKAMAEAKKALELDPTLAEPHCVLAAYHLLGEWDWKAAEREHRLAVQLDPNSASSRYSLSEYLRIVGRAEEALAELAKAQALDPNSIIVNSRLASFYADARKFQESLAQLELVKARDPKQEMVELRSRVLCALGRYPEAVESLRRARIDRGEPRERVDEEFDRIRHDVEAGDTKSFWRQQLTKAREQNDAFWQACAWAQLMETNQAIACLEQARDARAWRLTFSVMTDWRLDPVRSEPRFHGVLKSIHFE
jgi:tetratricopeptide (TPR) repeat protein